MEQPITPYYLTHFLGVIASVEKQYGAILSASEQAYIARIRKLPVNALCLYVRLVNRKGPYFRLAKITYQECMPSYKCVSVLYAQGFLTTCVAKELPYPSEKLLDCFTYQELREFFKILGLPKNAPKIALCELDDAIAMLLAQHEVIAVHPEDQWPFIKFLFFGELTDNLSGFVVQELKHIFIEKQPESSFTPHFATRKIAQDCYRMACLYEHFRELRLELSALELLRFWQSQAVSRNELSSQAWGKHDRLIEKLGKSLEREGHIEEAKRLYADCHAAPLRERYVRLLIKEGNKQAAIAICTQMLEPPVHAEEEYIAQQLLARLQPKRRSSEARQTLNKAAELYVEDDGLNIEASVLNHYRNAGWQGVHSENWLWNTLFGLLLWDIIYDPQYGSFHHPLQAAPADLYKTYFYTLRAESIEMRLALLRNKLACFEVLQAVAEAKKDTINPLFGWRGDLLPMLAAFLQAVPAEGLIAVMRNMSQDLKRRSKGFPDLFLWKGNEYQLLEVKSINDQLSPQQYYWLKFMSEQGINVKAVRTLIHAKPLLQEA